MRSKETAYQNPVYLEWIARIIVLGLWVLPLWYYQQLPEEIPSHFGKNGKADAYSSKLFVWFLPLIGTALFFFLHLLTKNRKLLKQQQQVKNLDPLEEERRITLSIKLLNVFKLLIPALFLFLLFGIIRTALKQADGLGTYSIYLFLIPIFSVIIYFLSQVYNTPKKAAS